MRRSALLLVAGLAIAALSASAAAAGGWATSELDEQLPSLNEDGTPLIGFTILQHGVTPAAVEGAGLRFTGEAGQVLFFDAEPQGATGHYLASVARLPAGTWVLEIEQGSLIDGRNGAPTGLHFEAFPLGEVTVAVGSVVGGNEGRGLWPIIAVVAIIGIAGGGLASLRGGTAPGGRLEYAPTTKDPA